MICDGVVSTRDGTIVKKSLTYCGGEMSFLGHNRTEKDRFL